MKIERQIHHECMLTTIAALSGFEYQEIRDTAYILNKSKPWSVLVADGNPKEFWNVVKALCKIYGLSLHLVMPFGAESLTPGGDSSPDLSGMGSIFIIMLTKEDSRVSHIMPYEDNLIYDSNLPELGGQTYQAWMNNLSEYYSDIKEVIRVFVNK